MRQYLPYLFSFRRLFQLACICGFPLFMLFTMTWGFVDSLPIMDNEYTSETLIVCGFLYMIISGRFYTNRPHVFLIFFTIGEACLLAGLAARVYYLYYSPFYPERGY
ncbi:hypothetical protein [Chitinophaga sp. RAB17]|uniref:hypothetical protein n=1 Tax=Chitinophaga sp. RAB17 TaxID=3233049 RepID=UPI003F8E0FD7